MLTCQRCLKCFHQECQKVGLSVQSWEEVLNSAGNEASQRKQQQQQQQQQNRQQNQQQNHQQEEAGASAGKEQGKQGREDPQTTSSMARFACYSNIPFGCRNFSFLCLPCVQKVDKLASLPILRLKPMTLYFAIVAALVANSIAAQGVAARVPMPLNKLLASLDAQWTVISRYRSGNHAAVLQTLQHPAFVELRRKRHRGGPRPVQGQGQEQEQEQEDKMNTEDERLFALAEEIAEVERRFLSEENARLLLGFTCKPRFAPLTLVL
jgi:hypothetical protein